MFRQCLKSSLSRRLLSGSYARSLTINPMYLKNHQFQKSPVVASSIQLRTFQASRPSKVPILPFTPLVLSFLKTGKLLNILSMSSKVSLSLLPHAYSQTGSKARFASMFLVGVPLVGFSLLAVIGLDKAPNTSRLRLAYLSDSEIEELASKEITGVYTSKLGLIADPASEKVLWLQTIADNIANVAVDDVRAPVRLYKEDTPAKAVSESGTDEDEDAEEETSISSRYPVVLINDNTVINAECIGSYIVVYSLLIDLLDYDPTKMAVILSHEIAHSVQKHFVEEHGFASLMFMFTDIARSILWVFTEAFGPHVNELINDSITSIIGFRTNRTYNRSLEKEADLIGLKFLAKAGYNPRSAVEVWERFEELHRAYIALGQEDTKASSSLVTTTSSEDGILFTALDAWFGSTHPPSKERIQYMKENMEEAIQIYEKTLKINGPAVDFEFSEEFENEKVVISRFDLLEILNLRKQPEEAVEQGI